MSEAARLEEFIKILSERLGKTYEYIELHRPAFYVHDNKGVGVGYLHFCIQVKPNWYITFSRFLALNSQVFQKVLLHYNDAFSLNDKFPSASFTRCHSHYIDEKDLEKKGGTDSIYDNLDIITALIHHAETHDETNCPACRGEDPLQTHYIQLI